MRRFAALCALVLLAIGAGISFTVATAPETAVSVAVAPSLSPAAPEPAIAGVTQPEAVEGRTAQNLVIDDVRRFDWRPGFLVPPDFDHTFEVLSDDPRDGYSGGPETLRLMLAHATSEGNPRGPSPGNAWLMLQPGDRVAIASGTYVVTELWDAPKPDYESQAPLDEHTFEQYTGALVLVTCVPLNDNSGRPAADNRWVVLRPTT